MKQYQKYNLITSALYIVPTPIGNLLDITQRALNVLSKVDLIAAEDTRNTSTLLNYFSIKTKIFSLYEHNEKNKIKFILSNIKKGKSIALVSNAGTPLISDPGYHLVKSCHKVGIKLIPLPGACAAITALSASGLPSNRFCYEGFLPKKKQARINHLINCSKETRTLIFYESTHRLIDSLTDIIKILGNSRYIVLARELTKIWETIYGATAKDLLIWIKENDMRRKGEIVLIIKGYKINKNKITQEHLCTLSLLLSEITLKKSVKLTSEIYGIKKNILYKYAINKKNIKSKK